MQKPIFLAVTASLLCFTSIPTGAQTSFADDVTGGSINHSFNHAVSPQAEAPQLFQAAPTQRLQNATYFKITSGISLSEAIDETLLTYPDYIDFDGLADSFDRRGANCSGFIQDDGSYGTYGKIIARGFREYGHLGNLISNDAAKKRGMGRLCPNFNKLSTANRVKFWVWTFAAIAWAESTCKPRESARGSTTRAVGLLQMEAGIRFRSWRGKLCGKFKDITSPGPNLLCGMEIMHGHFAGKYEDPKRGCSGKNAEGLVLRCSYWQKLRMSSSHITHLISLMPECGAKRDQSI